MADQDDDKKKQEKQQQSGSGRPGTKFMERPKPGQQQDPSPQNIPSSDDDDEGVVEGETQEEGGQGQQGQQKPKKGQQQQGEQGQQGMKEEERE